MHPNDPCNRFPAWQQPLVAVLLICALAVGGAHFLQKRFDRGPLVDIDQCPRRSARYQVDLNQAQWPELELLPGIGEKLAKAIVDHRTGIGCYRQHEQIMEIEGIGDFKFAALKPFLLPISNSD